MRLVQLVGECPRFGASFLLVGFRCLVVRSNEGARPGVSVFREAVGSLGWTESGSRAISRANPKSRTVKKVPTFPESTSSRLRKVRLSARVDAGGPAVARTGRIVAEAGHGGKEKKRAAGRTAESVPTFPETAAARDSKNIFARRGGVLRGNPAGATRFASNCNRRDCHRRCGSGAWRRRSAGA